ncbi:MAG: hypothetical protein LBV12_10165 [Puniceicoccales bacterium]|jgi:hypothetical protein|nr:hypothetical protein [Puniceicoccales bacterium]
MKTPPSKNFTPPPDNVSFFLLPSLGIWVILFGVSLFTSLHGAPWLWSYALALLLGIAGAVLIFYAKLPLYQTRRFITWGIKAIPQERRFHYRWGTRLALLAILLLLCLLLLTRHGLHPN